MMPFYEKQTDSLRVTTVDNLTFPLHLHTQLEILLVTRGHLTVSVENQTEKLGPESCAVIFPNQIHSFETDADGSSSILLVCNLNFTGDFYSSLTKLHPQIPFVTSRLLHRDVPQAFMSLLDEFRDGRNSTIFQAYTQIILARLMPLLALEKNAAAEAMGLTSQIAQTIAESFTEAISLDWLANRLGISKYHLSHLFVKAMGTNFRDYVNSFRLDYALQLIRSTDQSMNEIAFATGFESQRSFNRVFRKKFGIPPIQLRRANKGQA